MSTDNGALTGRVVAQHETVGITRDGWKVKQTVTLIDIGRPDPIGAVDPDAALGPDAPPSNRTANVLALNAARAKRQAELCGKVTAYLRQYGPMTAREMMRDLDVPFSTMHTHLRDHEGTVYCKLGKVRGSNAVLWDVVEGQD